LQRDDFTEYFKESVENIFAQTPSLYEKVHSLKEISAMTELSYTTIRDQLVRGGVSLSLWSFFVIWKGSWLRKKIRMPPSEFYANESTFTTFTIAEIIHGRSYEKHN
jgi:hypothetical protein